MSFICILLFKILSVGMFLIINSIPTILCFISVMWNVCLNGLVKSSFCSHVRVGKRNIWIFSKLVKFGPSVVAYLLEVLTWDVKFVFHSMWESLLYLILLLSLLKNHSE